MQEALTRPRTKNVCRSFCVQAADREAGSDGVESRCSSDPLAGLTPPLKLRSPDSKEVRTERVEFAPHSPLLHLGHFFARGVGVPHVALRVPEILLRLQGRICWSASARPPCPCIYPVGVADEI